MDGGEGGQREDLGEEGDRASNIFFYASHPTGLVRGLKSVRIYLQNRKIRTDRNTYK